MGKSQEAEQEAEQADVVNEIFTRYNTEDGRIHQDTVSLIFGELQEKYCVLCLFVLQCCALAKDGAAKRGDREDTNGFFRYWMRKGET